MVNIQDVPNRAKIVKVLANGDLSLDIWMSLQTWLSVRADVIADCSLAIALDLIYLKVNKTEYVAVGRNYMMSTRDEQDYRCNHKKVEALHLPQKEALLCFGAISTSVFEPDSFDSNDEISIVSIFDVSHDVHQSIALAADSIGLKETPIYKVTTGYHSDWIENARESFHPIEVTEGLWIVPEWITPPDIQATIISLNPGLAFGTGDHPTTKLCLLLLHGLIKGSETVMDYGTGSWILAIAALIAPV
ncbi:LOW QUALITY PROTEIN: hypothetical protein M8C21_016495 [Ambrosia artemisiifolia]|uniref:ETFB lysine methyltransferase n=1 Tax=Ambrosia artemisiifolia TaxID=4212 RepID=A0AAD5DD29_AMBAR|nr:LOW QUALITY PROTEIN: hypothetical protein M8C21_016495 [Ambrosia artemisiifolia]